MLSILIRTCLYNFHPIRRTSTIANQIAEAFVSKRVQYIIYNISKMSPISQFLYDLLGTIFLVLVTNITVTNIIPHYVKSIFDIWLVFLYDSFWELNNILWFFCNLEHWQLISLIYYSIRTLIRPIFQRPSGMSWIRPRLWIALSHVSLNLP